MNLHQLEDVANTFSGGQCIKRNTANTEWIGGTCTDASSGAGEGRLIALDSVPTDLTSYPAKSVIWVNTPSPGSWYEVKGANTGQLHGFKVTFEAYSGNPSPPFVGGEDLDFGYSSFGFVFGSIATEEGTPLSAGATPVMRSQIDLEAQSVPNFFDYSMTVLIRKTDLASPPTNIYARYYSGVPSNDNILFTAEFSHGSDPPRYPEGVAEYHSYLDTDENLTNVNQQNILRVKYIRFFTSRPSATDQVSNPLELHETKSAVKIDSQGLTQTAVDARINTKVPRQFRSDADVAGQLFQPTCFWSGTEAQYTAATKQAGCIYFRGQ